MTSPVASASQPRYLEMSRRFDTQSDGGRDMEVAMAATVFRDLQQAGYIPEGARLADEPPADGEGLEGTSYEARLVELIRDRDRDGRLDLDLDRLRGAGLLSGSPSEDDLERTLGGGLRPELSDTFLGRQARNSELSHYGVPNDRGERVQRYSRAMVLTTNQTRAQDAFVEGARARADEGPEEARQVAREAVAGAQLLERRGDRGNARRLLADTGQQLMNANRPEAAEQVYRELARAPYADGATNLVQSRVDRVRRQDPGFGHGDDISVTSGGTTNTIDVSDFDATYGELAGHRLRQIETERRMEAALGRDVDPRDMDDAQAYFQHYAQGRDTDAVREEYQRYLESFYVHTGHGVEWTEDVAEDDRPGRMTELLSHQPRDDAGRCLVDCEGYTYMTDRILGEVRTEDGDPRFSVVYATRPGHVISGVYDETSGAGFSVNNDATEMFEGDLSTNVGRAGALASELSGGYYNVISFSQTPSQSRPQESDGSPTLGSAIWDGHRFRGTVDAGFRQGYAEYRDRAFTPSLSGYIAELDRAQVD